MARTPRRNPGHGGAQADLYSAVLAASGLREEPGREVTELVRDRLGQAALLQVLDNCEHLRAPVADLVDDLLRHCATLRVLATSRVSVGLTGERVLALGGLDPGGDGVTLLPARARHVQPALPIGAATDGVAAEICRLADGLPLAIELAVAHARTLPLSGIRDGMADRMAFLAARRPGGLPRHGSVAGSLDWSAELVGEPVRRAGRAVGDRRALSAGGCPRRHRWRPRRRGDAGRPPLVQFDVVEGRYVLLETVREYAAGPPAASGTAEVDARLLQWAAAFARNVRDGLERAEPDALRRVAHADAAVASALDRVLATGRDVELVAGIAVDLAFGWSLQGRCSEGRVQRLAAALDPTPPALQWGRGALVAAAADRAARTRPRCTRCSPSCTPTGCGRWWSTRWRWPGPWLGTPGGPRSPRACTVRASACRPSWGPRSRRSARSSDPNPDFARRTPPP